MNSVVLLLSVVIAFVIVIGVTVLAIKRLRAGDPKPGTLGRWLRNVWDALAGID